MKSFACVLFFYLAALSDLRLPSHRAENKTGKRTRLAGQREIDTDGWRVMCSVHSWRDDWDRETPTTPRSVVRPSSIVLDLVSFLSESLRCSGERQHSKTQTIVAKGLSGFLRMHSIPCFNSPVSRSLPKGLPLFCVLHSKQSKHCQVFVVYYTITSIRELFLSLGFAG